MAGAGNWTEPNLTGGFDEAIQDIVASGSGMSVFSHALLFFVFFVIFMGGSNAQRKRTGSADMPFWGIIAGMGTFMVTLAMTLASGVIDSTTFGVVVAVNLLMMLWFSTSRNRNEV